MKPAPSHDNRYLAGIAHFNSGNYFEAHEVWEDLWRDCPSADRRFYQALIQAAVALYHHGNENRTGATRLLESGRRYMEPFRPFHLGLDVDRFWRDVESAMGDLEDSPRIELEPGPSPTPGEVSMSPAPDPVPLFGPEMIPDPYPYYHKLRAIDPVYWSERFNAWIVTGYDAVVAGLNDLRLSSDRSGLFQEIAGNAELEPFFSFLSKRMVLTDPPTHTRLRGLVSKVFTPHAVEAMRPHIQQLVDGFLDRVQGTDRIDLVHDLAEPLPITVITEMLGMPGEDRTQLKKWSDDFIVFFSTHPANITLDQYRAALQSMRHMVSHFRDALARTRGDAGPSLLRTMQEAEHHGDRLSEEEVFATASLFLVAGHETTTNLIGSGMYALLTHPEQLERLRSEPGLIPGAVEEFLRLDSPVQFTNRIAKEDVTLGGKTIRRGQFVFLFLAAANRDPGHFDDPDRLDVARSVHKHVAFGLGHHFCLGAPLARLEAQIALATLLRRFPRLRLAGNSISYRDNFNLRGLKALPLAFD